MKIGLLPVFALLAATAACEERLSDPLVLQSGGNYTYEAYGPDGTKALIGNIHLQWPDVTIDGSDRPLTGDWTIQWVPGADTTLQVGPQVGQGRLEGSTNDEGVVLNLNPGMMDNNVFLHAVVDGNTIKGHWTWSTIVGPSTEGRFTAVPGR